MAVSIPSRRVGDSPCSSRCPLNRQVSIPSRRVGDHGLILRFGLQGLVSIPSRRVGDFLERAAESTSKVRFHPLKAGRRRCFLKSNLPARLGFHPLKAGRRHESPPYPNRRKPLFPSPQGGSETFRCPQRGKGKRHVSIPSRRVGDMFPFRPSIIRLCSFHPLKAGRRPSSIAFGWITTKVSIPSRRVGDWRNWAQSSASILVSIPSRRVGDWTTSPMRSSLTTCFHPLKAGRRRACEETVNAIKLAFPSPQGGSETSSRLPSLTET